MIQVMVQDTAAVALALPSSSTHLGVQQRLHSALQGRPSAQQALLAVAHAGWGQQRPAAIKHWVGPTNEYTACGAAKGGEGSRRQGGQAWPTGSQGRQLVRRQRSALLKRLGQVVPAAHGADAQQLVVVQRQRHSLLLAHRRLARGLRPGRHPAAPSGPAARLPQPCAPLEGLQSHCMPLGLPTARRQGAEPQPKLCPTFEHVISALCRSDLLPGECGSDVGGELARPVPRGRARAFMQASRAPVFKQVMSQMPPKSRERVSLIA